MGLIGNGIFQARRDGRWVDVVSETDPGDVSVISWLDVFRPARGLPADFEFVDGEWHPIDRVELRPPRDRQRPYVQGHPRLGHICLGDTMNSWLHGDELLAGRRHAMAWMLDLDEAALPHDLAADDVPHWHDLGQFFDEVARLKALHGEIRLVFGLTY